VVRSTTNRQVPLYGRAPHTEALREITNQPTRQAGSHQLVDLLLAEAKDPAVG